MIVGEINIFQNLRGRASKAVTRVVFTIFFGFHIYVIIYASVVAYSIYNWEPESFNFSQTFYDVEIDDELYLSGVLINQVFDSTGAPINSVYDSMGHEVTEYIDDNGQGMIDIYDQTGQAISSFYDSSGVMLSGITNQQGILVHNYFYNDGSLAVITERTERLHTYGDFLYWTVITISTIGYGDVAPSTEYPVAQAWGGFLGMYGLTFFALSISFVSNIAMEGINSVREEHKKND